MGGGKHLNVNHNVTQLEIFEIGFAKHVSDVDTWEFSKTYFEPTISLIRMMKEIKMERKQHILILTESMRILSSIHICRNNAEFQLLNVLAND